MAAVLAAAVALGVTFEGRIDGALRGNVGLTVLRTGYTHYLTPVEEVDAPVSVLELFQGASRVGVALDLGANYYMNLEVNGAYFWEEYGAWGRLASGNRDALDVGWLMFLEDDLAIAVSLDLRRVGGGTLCLFRFGARYVHYMDERTLFIEGELGPVFEPGGGASFDLSVTARYFFTNETGVGVKLSTYGDDPLFPGQPYFAVLGEHYLDNGWGLKAALGGVGGNILLELGGAYRF